MFSFLISCLVILALIALIWGRNAAQGCAATIFRAVGYLIGGTVLLGVGTYAYVKLGLTERGLIRIGACLVGGVVGGLTWLAISSRIQNNRDLAQREQRDKQKRARRALNEHRAEERAQAALHAIRQRKASLPKRLAAALQNPHLTYRLCREASGDFDCCAAEWRGDENGGNIVEYHTFSQMVVPVPAKVAGDEVRIMRFEEAVRVAEVRTVRKMLEDAVRSADAEHQGQAVSAIFGLSAFAPIEGHPFTNDYATKRAVRFLDNLAWDATTPAIHRVAALLSLGIMGYDQRFTGMEDEDEVFEERLVPSVRDADAEIRAAGAFSFGLKLWSSLASSERATTVASDATVFEISDTVRALRRARHVRYEAALGAVLLPLLHDPDAHIRYITAQALRYGASDAFRDALRSVTADAAEVEAVRDAAARSLRDMGDVPLEPAPSSPDVYPPQMDAALDYIKDFAQRHHITLGTATKTGTRTSATMQAKSVSHSADPSGTAKSIGAIDRIPRRPRLRDNVRPKT